MKITHTLMLTLLVVTACTSESHPTNTFKRPLVTKEQPNVDRISSPKKKAQLIERTELKEKIEKKFGEQWDFCACILKNDSINKAFKNKLSPEQEDKLIDRWDFVESKCKELTTFENTTPEERAIYQNKVSQCLKNARLKN
jgi:hypothetical protein